MDQMNKLICLLMAIEGKAKDIHYNCHGNNFYGNHLFADRIADGLDDYIDQIKETCILGHGERPLQATEYFSACTKYINGLGNDFSDILHLIVECLAHIESMQNISRGDGKLLDDIANKFFFSKSYIISCFKNEFGISPKQYIIQKKIETAKNMLLETDMSIKAIAEMLHFADSHHFSNTFKKQTGLAPVEFRMRAGCN